MAMLILNVTVQCSLSNWMIIQILLLTNIMNIQYNLIKFFIINAVMAAIYVQNIHILNIILNINFVVTISGVLDFIGKAKKCLFKYLML